MVFRRLRITRAPRRLVCESLEARVVLSGTPIITELMAANRNTLTDGDGNTPDWIEIYNPTDDAVDLAGWHLTDSESDPDRWTFPDDPVAELDPGEYLVVFASGQGVDDYIDADGNLHTNFQLSAAGDYLALTRPDESVASEYAPAFPPQLTDISYGQTMTQTSHVLVSDGAAIEVLIPANDSLGLDWAATDFVPDGTWITELEPGVTATTGVGYDTSTVVPNLVSHWTLNEPSGTAGTGSVADSATAGNDGTPTGGITFEANGATSYTGTAASFSNGSIDVAYHSSLNPSSFTLTVWARSDTTSGFQSVVTNRFDGFPDLGGFVLYNNSGGNWSFWTGGGPAAGGWDTLDGPSVSVGTWTHLAISFDAATQAKTLWVNGEVAATTTAQSYAPNESRDLHIGGGGDLGDQYRFEGRIDDVGLYDAALDQTTIQTIMTSGVPDSDAAYYGDLINTDVVAAMQGVNASAYIRTSFALADPAAVGSLLLKMKYDDGFVAYLNGQQVASRNAPPSATWNSAATANRPDSLAVTFEEIDLSVHVGMLQPGTNVVAIHGLNRSATSSDFLILPELLANSAVTVGDETGYFFAATPRGVNPAATDNVGPVIEDVTHSPAQPGTADPLVVTAQITESLASVDSVTLHYRVMYGTESTLPMADDGTAADQLAGDGIFTAEIPAGVAAAGRMLRYYVTSLDTQGGEFRAPTFLDQEGNRQSAEYFGTVVADPAMTTEMPWFQWFTDNETNAHNRTGARASVFYLGEFYDNVFVRQRGQATNGSKSQKFVFDNSHRFYVNDKLGRVGEININGQGSDPSYLRQTLAFESYSDVGNASSDSFLALLHVNDRYDRVGIVIEQVDEDFLERNDLDPEGALYKFVQRRNLDPVFHDTITGIEKKTRLDEDWSDIQDLVDGLNLPTAAARHDYVMDHLNLPQIMNYLAVRSTTMDADDIRKNFYMYRDTNGNGLWSIFPWDKDFTFGVRGDGGPNLDHPFFGEYEHLKLNANQWNVMYDVLFGDPVTQEMYLRRLRSVMDSRLQTSDTPYAERLYEQRVEALYAPAADYLSNSAKNGVLNYFPQRRHTLFNTYGPGGTEPLIPAAQAENPPIEFGTVQYNPDSGNQDQEYIELRNPNPVAVDISGWSLADAVSHTFLPGTVIPAGQSVYVSPNVVEFRARTSGPSGGQGLFIQGDYSGHLSNYGETVRLLAADGTEIASYSYAGDPSPAQLSLRVTEINYNPYTAMPQYGDADVDAGLFEFIELQNTSADQSLDLTGVHFSVGITFDFSGSRVTSLSLGQRVVVVRDEAAFISRYGTGRNVAGVFTGKLSNNGEGIKLDDASGSTIQEFVYDDGGKWPGRADGKGATLEAIDLEGDYDDPENWRSSNEFNGTPGTAGTGPVFDVVVNEVLSHSDAELLDQVELYNVTGQTIDLGGWHLSDTYADYFKFTFDVGTVIESGEYLVLDENQFGFALDGQFGDDIWLLEGDPDLAGKPERFGDHFGFDATETDVSLGRVPNGDPLAQGASLFPMTAQTFGAPNSDFVVGGVILSEIHYHPAPLPPGQGPDIAESDLEFVELYNTSGAALAVGGWQFKQTDGQTFDLPAGTLIPAGETVVLVGFDPQAEPATAAAFRAVYGIDNAVTLVGGYSGKLDNSGETLKLLRPEDPDAAETGFILVDRVAYDDVPPWPVAADGDGPSLTRTAIAAFGNFATSWQAADPTPGSTSFGSSALLGDVNLDGVVNGLDVDPFVDVLLSGPFQAEADMNLDGVVNGLDVDPFVAAVVGSGQTSATGKYVAFRSAKMRTFAERTATYRENPASKSLTALPVRSATPLAAPALLNSVASDGTISHETRLVTSPDRTQTAFASRNRRMDRAVYPPQRADHAPRQRRLRGRAPAETTTVRFNVETPWTALADQALRDVSTWI
jgi:hypothetical protein